MTWGRRQLRVQGRGGAVKVVSRAPHGRSAAQRFEGASATLTIEIDGPLSTFDTCTGSVA